MLKNTSDIQPDTVHGDTQAQSLPVFALAYLLGIKLMPRIRNIGKLKFARARAGDNYANIDNLFDGHAIRWSLIENQLQEMLRIAVSIKLGKIDASTILRRLGNKSQGNLLYEAFYELGRVIRTLFLLDYIDDFELRKHIHAETNKCEEFNAFLDWSFFGGKGIIAENVRHEQHKLIKFGHLVANLVILYNVDQMTRVLAEPPKDLELNAELLSGLSPYRTSHINRFGDYTMDFSRRAVPMNHGQPLRIQ